MYEFLLVVVLLLLFVLIVFAVIVASTFPKTVKAFDKKLSDFIGEAE